MPVHLYLGGVRSGKSVLAEQCALRCYHHAKQSCSNAQLHYVATAQPFDKEMQARIKLHQERRNFVWNNHECPLELAATLSSFGTDDVVLVDCLTVWLNNVLYNFGDNATPEQLMEELYRLVAGLQQAQCTVVCVSTEVGLGVIPLGNVSRMYVDHAGRMNQAIAKIAHHVIFVVAGLAMVVKHESD